MTALTLGTYDGSNIEISERRTREHQIFGLRADEVQQVYASGTYLHKTCLTRTNTGSHCKYVTDGSLSRLWQL